MAARGRMIAATFLFCSLILLPQPSLASETTIPYPDPEKNVVHAEPHTRSLLDGGEGTPAPKGLIQGFYQKNCPQAEQIVNEVLTENVKRDFTLAAAIVRLFTHDCLVKGCDASILLEHTPEGPFKVERDSTINKPFIRGYEVIDEMKARLEAECPGVVSCADILAFANRDALVHSGVPAYQVAAGRRDGVSSLAANIMNNIPLLLTPAQEIIDIFHKKGLTLEEMVVLDGAHSIGRAHCVNVMPTIVSEKSKEMDPTYLGHLRSVCANVINTVPLDPLTPNKMDARVYEEFLGHRAVLPPDDALAKYPSTMAVMQKLAGDQDGWLTKFVMAVIKLGEIEVLTGNEGQIRKDCKAVN